MMQLLIIIFTNHMAVLKGVSHKHVGSK